MGVRVPGVVVINRHPIEGGVEVLLHLSHQPAREGLEIAEGDPILGRHDEPELVAVLQAALGEGFGVGLVLRRRIGMASKPVQRDALPLQVAQMGGDGLALDTLELDDPRLDNNATGPEPHAGAVRRVSVELPTTVAFEGRSGLSPSAAGIEPATGLALSSRMQEAAQVATLLRHRAQDQRGRRAWSSSGSATRFPETRFKIARLVFRHAIELAPCR